MMIVTLGLDLGKNWIHLVGLGQGRIVLRRRVRRQQLLALMPTCRAA